MPIHHLPPRSFLNLKYTNYFAILQAVAPPVGEIVQKNAKSEDEDFALLNVRRGDKLFDGNRQTLVSELVAACRMYALGYVVFELQYEVLAGSRCGNLYRTTLRLRLFGRAEFYLGCREREVLAFDGCRGVGIDRDCYGANLADVHLFEELQRHSLARSDGNRLGTLYRIAVCIVGGKTYGSIREELSGVVIIARRKCQRTQKHCKKS